MQKGFAPVYILVGVLILVAVGGGAFYFGKLTFPFLPSPRSTPVPKACTEKAKICPDGSSVGRVGPNCEFAPCPSPKDDTTNSDLIGTNWKTYMAERFSFKYPPSWNLQTCGVPEGIYLDEKGVNCAGGPTAISIWNTFSQDSTFSFEKSRGTLVKESNISLGGVNALQAEIDTGKVSDSGFRSTITRVKIGNSIYDLELDYSQVSDDTAARKIYNQIISTFNIIQDGLCDSKTLGGPFIQVIDCYGYKVLVRDGVGIPEVIVDPDGNRIMECGGSSGYSQECQKKFWPYNYCQKIQCK